jgi:hypothetical protein
MKINVKNMIKNKNRAAYPPNTLDNVRVQYFHRPHNKVNGMTDKIQTARNDCGASGEEEDTAGISNERNVERCTMHEH